MDKLKPCPFCGADVAVIATCQDLECCDDFDECDKFDPNYGLEGWYVGVCDVNKGGCGASSRWSIDINKAIKLWNQRAGENNER